MKRLMLAVTAIAVSDAAHANEYLTSLTSETYQAEGTPDQLARTASTCIAQQLASGQAGGQVIISADPAAGIVVANNALQYRDGLMVWSLRSRLTFEAREGRFRIAHTAIERFNDASGGWSPVGKWRGSGAAKAEAALADVSATVAACVRVPAREVEEW